MGNIKEKMYAYKLKMFKKLLGLKDIQYIDLSEIEESRILKSLLNMPFNDQSLLIFKNYYHHTFDELEDILGVENAEGEYLYLNSVLSEILGYSNKFISEKSMIKVSNLLAKKVNEENLEEFDVQMKEEKQEKKIVRFKYFYSKKVASFAICVLLGTSVLFSVNAFADGKIFEWIVETFEKYSSFSVSEENIIDKADLDIEITYIPEGFELHKQANNPNSNIYYYRKEKEHFVIRFIYNDIDLLLNTEESAKETIEMNGKKIIFWEKDDRNYFVLNKNNIGCLIYGSIDKDEAVKIYNGVSIKK